MTTKTHDRAAEALIKAQHIAEQLTDLAHDRDFKAIAAGREIGHHIYMTRAYLGKIIKQLQKIVEDETP